MAAIVTEGTSAYITVTFRDRDGNPSAPESATYQVHDVKSKQELIPETDLVPAPSVEITIPPSANMIVNEKNREETRRVTVKAVYGQNEAINAEYDYVVKNLDQV